MTTPIIPPLEVASANPLDPKIAKLREAFPEVFTDGKVDIERLATVLGKEVETSKERYGLNWPGKSECFKTIRTPSTATLRPKKDESVNWDTTENVFIEGDNLEVLKLLQKSYIGKVKMIYIDPPYNTGSDFIYPDNYSESLATYLEYTGQVDSDGKRWGTNLDTDGRFHSKWINMMYPRLFLAKNLLREDGVIFISIDDHEMYNLKFILDEVFGPENFLGNFIWKKKAGGGDDSGYIASEHEYILCYGKNYDSTKIANILHESKSMTAKYNKIEDGRRYYLERLDKTSLTYGVSMDYPILCPDGTYITPFQPDPNNPTTSWRWSKSKVEELRSELVFEKEKKTGIWRVYTKTWESLDGVTPRSLLVEPEHGRNRDGTQELSDLLGPKVFSNPKPTRMIKHLLSMGASENESIVLDFFAGSGSTGHALFELSMEDAINRKFVLVQLPEKTERIDYLKISDITIDRLKKAGKRVEDTRKSIKNNDGTLKNPNPVDIGFRVFSLDTSNMRTWDASSVTDKASLETQLTMHMDHIAEGRSEEDLLAETILKSGFPLSTAYSIVSFAGKRVYSIAEGAMFACFEDDMTLECIRAMADSLPLRVVCLDSAFHGNDQLKTNVVEIMRTKGIDYFHTI